MPNHPALVDPMIMVSHTALYKIFSPIMTETYFHTPGLWIIVKALAAVPVGDLARWGSISDVNSAFASMIQSLEEQKNLLLYPSWHIYVQGFEHIVWKKMAYELISRVKPTQRIILARTRWLWWSIWSKAYTGTSPKIHTVLVQSIWYILANFVFFVPKRNIAIEFVDMTGMLRKWHSEWIDIFNKNLEDFYNEPWAEECRFIRHYFYHDDTKGMIEPEAIEWSVRALEKWSVITQDDVPLNIYSEVIKIVADIKGISVESIQFKTNLILDLHADSLDMAEMKSKIQSLYSWAWNPPIAQLITVGDLMWMATWKITWQNILPGVSWDDVQKKKIEYTYKNGDTIIWLMLDNFYVRWDDVFIYDTILWGMDRKTFLLRAYVVWEVLSHTQWSSIGIMMPALASTSLLLAGTYLWSKLPVMLNWTVWEKSFAHCMEFAWLETILTSRKFYEKIQTPWLKQYESKMIFVEDIVQNISTQTKIVALIKKTLRIRPRYNEYAVMLFTSGSESLPKAVRLSHENILSDISWALGLVDFYEWEVFMGILPPFHSFGFTINTICPLIFPLRAVYSPDPNDAKTIATIIKHTQATILAGTPTFLRMIFNSWSVDTFSSLHFAIAGAEKCTPDTFSLVKEKCPQALLLEWYGITECSPIVTVNPTSKQKQGSAGKFIPTIDYTMRNLDGTGEVKVWEQGMLYVSGLSIFSWYLDEGIESPFEEWDNKKWYKTGDLGYVDGEGYFFITGRLKRFVKIAGEMVSLPFIETILLEKYGNPEYPTIAIEAKEIDGEVTIVAFSVIDIALDELNDYIHSHGAANIIKIHRLERIDTIPILWTGKTDYKQLKSLI